MTAPSDRSRIRRLPDRGSYDQETIYEILDEALICHVGFVDETGLPVVIPTIHARVGNVLYLHGSPASRMLRTLRAGRQVSVAATILDGLVLAKSQFHHSMNYRSVVVFGSAREVKDEQEKASAFRAIVEHLVPGRSEGSRPANDKEVKATAVAAIDIEEASAKQRSGPPVDDDDDIDLPYWAGVIPLALEPGEPASIGTTPLPDHVSEWKSRR
ncbi:MAG TPA: pyridoxamine 5'-phosphate oxidase family protein [Acidimicrobiia bacterium]|nr:pyridoxamine 5'-phosphate oxidase family protein [Acidimicrobiia bacterium]